MAMPSVLFADFRRTRLKSPVFVFRFFVFFPFALFAALAALTALTALPGHCAVLESITFDSKWPDASPGNILPGAQNDIIIYGSGNTLTLIRPGTGSEPMTELSRIELPVKRGITGISQDFTGNTIFAACGSMGLAVVDITDRSAPIPVSTLEFDPDKRPVHATALDFLDSRLYIADVYFGLRVIDVSNPANPSQIGTFEQISAYTDSDGNFASSSGGHINLKMAGINGIKYAFVLDMYYGLRVFDVSIDSAPSFVAEFDMRSKELYGQLSKVVDLAVDDRYLYISDSINGITILDVFSDQNTPKTINITKKGQIKTPGSATGVTLVEDTLYVADGNSGLLVVDVADRSLPGAVFTHQTTGAYGVVEINDILFLADTADGIARLELSPGHELAKTGSFDTPASVDAVFADGTHAYLLDRNGDKEGLTIISVSNKGEYFFTGALATPGDATAVFLADDMAYVADGKAGITIIDVEDKAAPAPAGTFKPGGDARDILVHAFTKRAYVADKIHGLVIADVTDDGSLTEKATLYIKDALALAYTVQNDRTYLLVANLTGLHTVDISDPDNPVLAGYVNTPGQALDVGVRRGYAVVADGENGVVLIDISNPVNPFIIDTYDTQGRAGSLFVQDAYVHVADGSNGLVILGIVATDPVKMTLIDGYQTPGKATGVTVNGQDGAMFTYVADGKGGFISFAHSDRLGGGIDEKPFPDSPDDSGWDRANSSSCFISNLF